MASYRFLCKHPEKYAGDPKRIVARSKWELMYMQALDNSNIVYKWISEPKTLNITYISPLDNRLHQYWPDFLVQYIDGSRELIEIKPLKETLNVNAKSTYDKLMLIKNVSKWTAAEKFARRIGARFKVITENNLFPNKKSGQSSQKRQRK